jgi:hypothetical protein
MRIIVDQSSDPDEALLDESDFELPESDLLSLDTDGVSFFASLW